MIRLSTSRLQVVKFGLVGVIAGVADLSFYYFFLQILPEHFLDAFSNEAIAKAISFVIGTTIAYYLNKLWTWQKKDKSTLRFLKFLVLYALSLVINVSVNSMLLYVLHSYQGLSGLPFKYLIAFFGAVGASAVVTFVGQKFWVFKHSEAVEA